MKLSEQFRDVYVVRKDETVEALNASLERQGFRVHEVRGPYSAEMADWSPNTLCMVNHRNAWNEIEANGRASIVVEADFVPVEQFGELSVPSGWSDDEEALLYLYACGPQLWDLEGGLRGHAGSMVAYCVSPVVASRLIEFGESEILSRNPEQYSGWDSVLGFWLNARGIESYLPYRHYGEHGGLPNREHRHAGLKPQHRADLLAGRLAFLPTYARGSWLRFVWIRMRARCWGMARLLSGRYLAWHDFWRSKEKLRLLRVAIGRHCFRSPARRSTRAFGE